MVKYFFKRAAMLMALAAVVIASGCKQTVNTETVNTGTTAVAVTGIKLNKGDLSLKVDESKKLAATVMPANATNKQVTWTSDKPTVATVSPDGTVTAKKEGTAQITVKTVNGGKTARCKITVTAKDPTPTAEFTVEMTHGEHGTISASPAIPASGKIAKDTSITFTAKADTGFSVDTWTITGGEILDGTGTEGSLTAKVKITANTKVSVTFKKKLHKVTFDAKGGLPVPTEQHVLYKEKACAPTEQPIKEGYTLEGWFNKDGDASWDFTVNEVTKDTELYAKWKTKKYTVNFNVDGGDGNLTATLNGSSFTTGKEVEYEKTVEFTAESEEGYKVDKWTITGGEILDGTGTEGSLTAKVKITANTTVKVSFKKKEYRVTFDAKGGLPVPTEQHVLYKEKASAPTVPAKEGYDLDGWFNKDGDTRWDFAVNEVMKDTELYAKWKAKKYAVNFNVDGSNGTLKAKLDGKPFTGGDINFGKTVIFTAEPNEGYAVEQWTLNGTEAPASEVSTTYQCSVTAETEVRVRFIRKKEAGLIVLSNGLFKRRDNYTTIDPQNPPVAVIAGKLNGNIFGIALRTSGREFSWAKYGSTGTNFEGIVCTPSNDDAQTATFTDDTDGSDNWKYICSIDPNGTVNAAENYPAFYWVNTYNETYKTKLGGKTFAWYMPSVAELCEVYKNRGAIAASLKKINRLDSHYAETSISFDTSLYWSSSQKSYVNESAWRVNFYGGSMDYYSKSNKNRVCCIAVF